MSLTPRQQHAHDRIARCTCCGTWTISSRAEITMREGGLIPADTTCTHLDPHLTQRKSA